MKKQPDYFRPYSKPWPPRKPPKTLTKRETIVTLNINAYDTVKVADLQGAESFNVEARVDGYGELSITVTGLGPEQTVENPNYENGMVYYKSEYKLYRARMKEWNAAKKIFDAQQAEQKAKEKKAMYERLKKEFET